MIIDIFLNFILELVLTKLITHRGNSIEILWIFSHLHISNITIKIQILFVSQYSFAYFWGLLYPIYSLITQCKHIENCLKHISQNFDH